jgi:hypothetical protein
MSTAQGRTSKVPTTTEALAEADVGSALRSTRLDSLLLTETSEAGPRATPASVVEWFGAMQAQDLASAMWSLGLRVAGADISTVTAAIESGQILRTWPMRGTVHFVPPADARWMLALMGAKPLAGAARRRAFLGLSEADAELACDVLGEALSGGRVLTRAECVAAMAAAGIAGAGNYAYHLLWFASQRGITCIGPNRGTEQTFVLLDDWAPNPHQPDRAEALATMALRFFRSHGPATPADFTRWTGLSAADRKQALAEVGDALVPMTADGIDYLLAAEQLDCYRAALDQTRGGRSAHGAELEQAVDVWVLPGFDEFILGYKDRSLMLEDRHKEALIPGGNGVFRATLVAAGRVVGTWTRTMKTSSVQIDAIPFGRLPKSTRLAFDSAFDHYALYLGTTADIRWGRS